MKLEPIAEREIERLARLLCEEMGQDPDATIGQTLKQARLDGRTTPRRRALWQEYRGRAEMMLAERRAMARFLGAAE